MSYYDDHIGGRNSAFSWWRYPSNRGIWMVLPLTDFGYLCDAVTDDFGNLVKVREWV